MKQSPGPIPGRATARSRHPIRDDGRRPGWARLALVILIIAVHVAIAVNIVPFARDMLLGDGSSDRMLIEPRHGFMRIPSGEISERYRATGRIGADFAQIYFPTRSPESIAYTRETTDPWHRASRYAPFVHALCEWTICRLDYGPATLLHVSLQYAVFAGSMIFASVSLGLARMIPALLSFVNVLVFLTPVGLAALERGQFSLYVAAAYCWLLLAVLNRSALFGIIAAVLGYLKLTSLPFMFVTSITWLVNARTKSDLYGRLGVISTLGATLILAFMLYYAEGLRFLSIILAQEYLGAPSGMSLTNVAPAYVIKALPFAAVAASVWLARKCTLDFSCWFPFALGAAVLFCFYPTVSYDYSAPTLYALLPFVLWWTPPPGKATKARRYAVKWGFPVLLAFVSLPETPFVPEFIADRIEIVYLAWGVALLVLAFLGETSARSGTDRSVSAKTP